MNLLEESSRTTLKRTKCSREIFSNNSQTNKIFSNSLAFFIFHSNTFSGELERTLKLKRTKCSRQIFSNNSQTNKIFSNSLAFFIPTHFLEKIRTLKQHSSFFIPTHFLENSNELSNSHARNDNTSLFGVYVLVLRCNCQ
ncbi:hypothetical protein QL285_088832 [Trifolium repens]|nr:hypothetical protein QL285_088832 [Trifolium repens]